MDLDALLAPISDDAPTGNDLRMVPGDETFSKIEELKSELEASLDVEGKGKPANWPAVVRECEDALTEKTKDLDLVTWLVEGLAQTRGFEGLRDGLHLLREVLDRYWEQAYPGLEDGEIIAPIRARPITWLGASREFLRSVREIPITRVEGLPDLCWLDYEDSERVDEASIQTDQARYQELIDAGKIGGADWQARLNGTDSAHLEAVFAQLQDCEREVQELDEACQKRFGEDDVPQLMRLQNLLRDVREHLEPLVRVEETAPAGEAEAGGQAPAGAASAAAGHLGTRQEALKRLAEVAEFFRRTEPHSPISYLVERAVRWGNMPFDQVMRDVVKTPDALSSMWETLGIQVTEAEE